MKIKNTRAEKAGKSMALSIIEMINLMYQNNTAKNFLKGLVNRLSKELIERDFK